MDTTTQAPGAADTAVAPPPAAPAPVIVEGPTFPAGTKLREYETIYALKPDLTDDVVDKFKEKIRSLIVRDGGKVIKFTVWGKKKTHFEMDKQNRAIYTHVLYLGPAAVPAELQRNLKNEETVIRYQTIKLNEETDASKPVEADVKLAGDVEAPERPPREERERRDDFGGAGDDVPDGPDFGDESA